MEVYSRSLLVRNIQATKSIPPTTTTVVATPTTTRITHFSTTQAIARMSTATTIWVPRLVSLFCAIGGFYRAARIG